MTKKITIASSVLFATLAVIALMVVLGLFSTNPANAKNNSLVTVTYPNEGAFKVGETMRISWDTSDPILQTCRLYWSTDQVYFPVDNEIAWNVPNTGYYDWVVQKDPRTENEKITVICFGGNIVPGVPQSYDQSDDWFTVAESGT